MRKPRYILVERDEAQTYLLLSLVAFGSTVIIVRLFLQLTGYPQIASGTLHIAHLLWGGLCLFVAVLLVLIWDNPGALRAAAALSGIGIGLFIDEVGKFITQTNDYFFPPAAPIIYGFFLVTVFLYLYIRRPDELEPGHAMVLSLEKLQDAIYGDLEREDIKELAKNLALARQSERREILALANILYEYVQDGNVPFKDNEPRFLRRIESLVTNWGLRIGCGWHRGLILGGLVIISLSALVTVATLIWVAVSPDATTQVLLADLVAEAARTDTGSIIGHYLRVLMQVVIGVIALSAVFFILRGKERRGLTIALVAVILSLTALQLVTFYLDQFTAIIPTIFQFSLLLLILAYRHWYMSSDALDIVNNYQHDENTS
jgi:hypothetical protein